MNGELSKVESIYTNFRGADPKDVQYNSVELELFRKAVMQIEKLYGKANKQVVQGLAYAVTHEKEKHGNPDVLLNVEYQALVERAYMRYLAEEHLGDEQQAREVLQGNIRRINGEIFIGDIYFGSERY